MIDLTLKQNTLKAHVLAITGEVMGVSDEWLLETTRSTGTHSWVCTDRSDDFWITGLRTPKDETDLYASIDFVVDCIRCFFTVTKNNVKRTVKGIVELNERIPGFADGWTFVDYYAGIGLSSIYFAQLLEESGIDANVVYHNSPTSKMQIKLAKRFAIEAGSPKNLEFQISDDLPDGECYAFYEVLEHFRKPWTFMLDLIERKNPQAIIHASSFNLPDCAGHFEVYNINDRLYSGPEASKHFEKCFTRAGYVNVNSSHCWDNAPSWQVRRDLIDANELDKKGRWNLKAQALESRRDALVRHKCATLMHDFKATVDDSLRPLSINDKDWSLIEPEMLEKLIVLAKDVHRLKGSGF